MTHPGGLVQSFAPSACKHFDVTARNSSDQEKIRYNSNLASTGQVGVTLLRARVTPKRNSAPRMSACSSGVLEALRDDAAALGKLGHDLFVEPDIHLSRAVEAAFVGELLRKLLAGGET
jgi:hypothetical protein